jgi:hypothetical protein
MFPGCGKVETALALRIQLRCFHDVAVSDYTEDMILFIHDRNHAKPVFVEHLLQLLALVGLLAEARRSRFSSWRWLRRS